MTEQRHYTRGEYGAAVAVGVACFLLGWLTCLARGYLVCADYWEATIRHHYGPEERVPHGQPERYARRTCTNEALHLLNLPWRVK